MGVAVVCQVALSVFMFSLAGFTFVIDHLNLAYGLITPLFSYPQTVSFYWAGPTILVIYGIIGLIFARVWFKLAVNLELNVGRLILVAILSFVVTSLCSYLWASVSFFSLYNQLWLSSLVLIELFGAVFIFSYFPSLVVLVASGGIKFYHDLLKGRILSSIDTLPHGVRTSHFVLSKALHREQDRVRETP